MKKQILLTLFISIFLIGLVSAGSITLSGPSSATVGSTFQISYTANGVSGNWGATLTSSISGGCTVNGKTSLNIVMLSDLPNPLTYTVTAPSSAATCTISGDSKFGTDNVNPFNSYSVTIGSGGSTCTPTTCGSQCGSISNGCGGTLNCGTCTTCTPITCGSNCGSISNGCGGTLSCGACASSSSGSSTNPTLNLDINAVIFTLGTFQVTLLYLLIAAGIILALVLLK